MRNPRRWRNVALAFLVAGLAAVMTASLLLKGAVGETLVVLSVLLPLGITATLLSIMFAVDTHWDVRAQASLHQGEDGLARWHIDSATWRAFIALNEELNRVAGAYPNELSIRKEIPAQGIQVMIGK